MVKILIIDAGPNWGFVFSMILTLKVVLWFYVEFECEVSGFAMDDILPFIVALETLEFTDPIVDDTGLIGIFTST